MDTFELFCSNIKPGGTLVYNADCPNTQNVARRFAKKKVSYGLGGNADYRALNITFNKSNTTFDIYRHDEYLTRAVINLPGEHNVSNALAATAAAMQINMPIASIVEGLNKFKGVKRRFEIYSDSPIAVVDDYAHHPTEIKALLKSAKQRFKKRRIIALFQPHQISRTRLLLNEFAAAFDLADIVMVTDIYKARDSLEKSDGSSETLVRLLADRGCNALYSKDITYTKTLLLDDILETGDVVITIGAGDIFRLAAQIYKKIN
jgi:UDP-N-acetylmuramate--alanine ligase